MKTNPTRALAVAAGVVIIALTGAAFWLSYAHLAEVALAHGMRDKEIRAWAWPATLDLFIVAGELMMLRAALARRIDWWAIGLTVAGSLGSIGLNVAGVGSTADPLDYVVAAVPPTAALLAFGALMRQVHQALAGHAKVTTQVTVERADDDQVYSETTPAEVVMPPVAELPPTPFLWDAVEARQTAAKVTTAVPAQTPRQLVTEVIALTPSELLKRASKLNRDLVRSTNRPVTIARLQDEFNLSRRDAAELRRQVVTSKGDERS